MANRKHRFRVWQVEKKLYLHSDFLLASRSVPVIDRGDHFELDDEFVIFEEYTDRKDKSGREIIEGDIVHCDSPNHNCNLEVRFGIMSGDYDYPGFYLHLLGTPFDWQLLRKDLERGDYTVIGNIRENPELLEPNSGVTST